MRLLDIPGILGAEWVGRMKRRRTQRTLERRQKKRKKRRVRQTMVATSGKIVQLLHSGPMRCRGSEIFSDGTFLYLKRFGDGAGVARKVSCWSWDENRSYLSCVTASFSSLVFKQQSFFVCLFVLPSRKAKDIDRCTIGSSVSPISCPVPPPSSMHLWRLSFILYNVKSCFIMSWCKKTADFCVVWHFGKHSVHLFW